MIGLDEVIERDEVAIRPIAVVVAPEPAPARTRGFRFHVPRIVDYLIVAAFIYFLF